MSTSGAPSSESTSTDVPNGSTTQTYTGSVGAPFGLVLQSSSGISGNLHLDTPITLDAGIATTLPLIFTVERQWTSRSDSPSAELTALITLPGGQSVGSELRAAQVTFSRDGTPITTSQFALQTVTSPSSRSSGSSNPVSSAPITSVTLSSSATSSADISTTTSQASSTTTPSVQSQSSGYGAGALAGAAVGCLVGGALIAGLVIWFLMRRKPGHRRITSTLDKEMSPLNGHGEAVYLNGAKSWENALSPAEPDSKIRNATTLVLDQIDAHVQDHYRDTDGGDLSIEVQTEIEEVDSPYLPGPLLSLIPQVAKPTLLIKHCIANLIMSRIASASGSNASFLPATFTSMKSSERTRSRPEYQQASAQWRILTAHLRADPALDQTYLNERDAVIDTAVQQICQAFEPWSHNADEACRKHLAGIMQQASELGITLFAQGASFEWQWTVPDENSSRRRDGPRIVTLPGLYKTADKEGQSLATPTHLLEPRVVPLEEI